MPELEINYLLLLLFTDHQPGLILPSWWNVRQKAAVTTLCTLWFDVTHKSGRDDAKSVGSVDF